MLLSGCGSDSNNNDNNDNYNEHHTMVSGIAIADGYLSEADVCLDTKNTYTCKDEIDYVTRTDSNGYYNLSFLPNSALNKYNIVVETTENTYAVAESNSNYTTFAGAGRILAVPGYFSNSDKELVITPLVSLATKYSDSKQFPFMDVYEDALHSMGVDDSIDLTRIDYITYQNDDEAFKALKVFNENLFNSTEYQNYFTEDLVEDGTYLYVQTDTQLELGKPFSESITLEKLERYVGDIAIDWDSFGEKLPELLELNSTSAIAGTGEERYQRISEERYQKIQDAVDGSNMIRTIAITAISIIPKIGIFVGPVVEVFWEKEQPDFLALIYEDAIILIKQEIEKAYSENVKAEIKTLRYFLQSYKEKKDPDYFKKAYDSSEKMFADISHNAVLGYKMLPHLVLLGNIRMILSKERYEFFETLAPKRTQEQVLSDWVIDYKKVRDALVVGQESMSQKFMVYRTNFIKVDTAPYMSGFMEMFQYSNGTVHDEFTGWKIHMRTRTSNNPGIDRYVSSANNIKNRIIQDAKLKVAKQLSSVFVLPKLFPEGKLDSFEGLSMSEKSGLEGYFVPDDFKAITIDSISRGCMEFLWYDTDNMSVVCNANSNIKEINSGVNSIKDVSRSNWDIGGFKFYAEDGASTSVIGRPGAIKFPDVIPGDGYYLVGFQNISFYARHGRLVNMTPVFSKVSEKPNETLMFKKLMTAFSDPPMVMYNTGNPSLDYRITGAAKGESFDWTTMSLKYTFFPNYSPEQ